MQPRQRQPIHEDVVSVHDVGCAAILEPFYEIALPGWSGPVQRR